MQHFFRVKPAADARRVFERPAPGLQSEEVALDAALSRVLAKDLRSPIDLPEFSRAVVDGYAVRAADTFGASPNSPAYLLLAGEIAMGRPAEIRLERGQTARISTGGMLPEGADAVVMVEYVGSAGGDLVEVLRSVAPGEGTVSIGDDVRKGDRIVPRGRRLRPQDLGAAAAVGVTRLEVVRRPRVAVIPTGDEVVPRDAMPAPGQVRDVNTTALCAAVRDEGGEPVPFPIVPDDPEALRAAVAQSLESADLTLLAGGSSVGARDWTLETLLSFEGAELLLHGAAIRPGKPVIVVAIGERLLVGLPGNPVSALVVFRELVRPYLRRLAGISGGSHEPSRPARMACSCASDPGKEDYLRVRLVEREDGWWAEPLLGKSALLFTMVQADGLVVIPEGVEGLEEGEQVEVRLL